MSRIKNWFKNKMIQLKNWFKKLLKRFIRSRFFLGIVMLSIGISYTVCYYEVKVSGILESEKVVIFYRDFGDAVAQASATLEISENVDDSREGELEDNNISSLPPTVESIKKISAKMDFDWKIIWAIWMTESKGNKQLIGDSGQSKGPYHIYNVNVCEWQVERYGFKKEFCIKDKDRMDFEKSTKWTIARLQRHASLGRREMIRSHNGLIADHSNDWYVDYVEELINKIREN